MRQRTIDFPSFNHPGLWLLAGLLMASGQPAGALPKAGLYTLTGADTRWGPYRGEVELRPTSDGRLQVIHLQEWTEARFEGESIALAWEGMVEGTAGGDYVTVPLDRVGFITQYAGWERSRDPADNGPGRYRARLDPMGPTTLVAAFEPVPDGSPDQSWAFTETWTWRGPPSPTPIWRNQRSLRPGHAPIPPATRRKLFRLFHSYHAMPEVAYYADRPEFQQAMHSYVVDHTDYDYYREHPSTLRVIQKMVDPISLAETRRRAQAYRLSLADKQAIFDPAVPRYHLNEAGMLTGYDPTLPADRQQTPDGDSLLWTGAYVASQAMRFQVTGEPAALDNLMTALNGQLLCYEIVPTPGDFARTLRAHVPDAADGWVPGEGEYSAFDWKPGGNNDMLKGFLTGFLWANLALTQAGGQDALRARMRRVVDGLLEHNPLLQVDDLADVPDTFDRMAFLLLAHALSPDDEKLAEYERYFKLQRPWLTNTGNGTFYRFGIADWSGLHLGIQSNLALYVAASYAADPRGILPDHLAVYRETMAKALINLRSTRLGLLQLVYGTLGAFDSPPAELDDALWMLREFPAPKERHAVDWSINPGFVLSPFPELPWKLDWTEGGRFQSLVIYPLFEKGESNYRWKVPVGSYDGVAEGDVESGVDYLLAYWFGRYFGVIAEGE